MDFVELSAFVAENLPLVISATAVFTALAIAASALLGKKTGDRNFHGSIVGSTSLLSNKDSVLQKDQVQKSVAEYDALFKGVYSNPGANTDEASIKLRQERYQMMVNHFYDLVTDFYEWGWGQSFHFAPRWKNEDFHESLRRAEYHLCSRLGMKPGMRIADIGCGVGGPMRNMARFSGSSIEGITINEYQVRVGNKYNKQKGLEKQCLSRQGDFQNLPWEAKSFDGAYQIEATCHSPDKVHTFSQVNKVLKVGAKFAGYEWVVCNNYDPKNARHVSIKEGIEAGNGLPTLATPEFVQKALEEAGFEVEEAYDANRGVHDAQQVPWYDTLNGKMTLSGFRMTRIGRMCTHSLVTVLETLRIAPKGSVRVSEILNSTAIDLVEGGQMEIFTPSYFFVATKVRDV